MLNRSDFPDDFVFGVATSSYQIEGHAQGGAGRTHWDDFAATPGNVVNGEDGALACDHLNRLDEDLDLMGGLGVDAYRFSTSWARILPEGRGAVNEQGLDFYERLVDGLLERGIRPALTLYHWEMPSTLNDLGGWRNPDVANWFADFSEIVMGRLGDRLWSVATINEPWCVGWLSHFLGGMAPGLRDIRATARAMHHILLAHGRATQAMRAMGQTNLGAVLNLEWATPLSDRDEDVQAAARYDAIYNRFFMGGLFKGEYPERVLEGLGSHLPDGWENDFDTIRAPVDWCGINYYTRSLLTADGGAWPAYAQVEGPLPKTAMGWEIYPEGIYDLLTRTAREYTGDLPLYVTENGMAGHEQLDGNGTVEDGARIAYISAHQSQVLRAIADGAPVKGYMVWSLMDNYEWAFGYKERFGLVHVDFETLKRTPKASYHALATALER